LQPQMEEERPVPSQDEATDHDQNVTRTLLWIGVAGLSAALAFTLVRALMMRRPGDPTSQRIQTLIDEANQLLKTLDDKKHR
jgi:hypothetical protein